MPKKKPAATNGAITTRTITREENVICVSWPVSDYDTSQYLSGHVETNDLDLRQRIMWKLTVSASGKSGAGCFKSIIDAAADEINLPTDIEELSGFSGKIRDIPR